MEDRRKRYLHNIPAARDLRRPQTPTEARLWESLRDRRFAGLKFRRQHAVGRFVLDFFCHELRLAVEVDGSIHDSPEHQASDAACQGELEATGIRFVRIPAGLVENDLTRAIERIQSHISDLQHPS